MLRDGTGYEAAKLLVAERSRVKVFARNVPKAKERLGEDVEVVAGDLRDPKRMPEAVKGAEHIIFTAGVTKRPCKEDLIVATEFEAMKKTIDAAKEVDFRGRFLFLSSIGVTNQNWASRLLNKVKGNALFWRKEMEDLIRGSGFDYTIVRAGYLMNSVSTKEVELSQTEYPLELRYRIGRKEAARVFVEAIKHEAAGRKTFDAVRGPEPGANDWHGKFAALEDDRQ
jgi:uncharacterized protein YbjT (DUF2867 family)